MAKQKSANRLGNASSFRFISPYSLEECVDRLESKRKRWRIASPDYITVNLTPMSEDSFRFHIVQCRQRNIKVEAKGMLERQFENATLVQGNIGIPPYYRWMIVFLAGVFLVNIFVSTNRNNVSLIIIAIGFAIAGIAVLWLFISTQTQALKSLVTNALNGSEYIENYGDY